MTEPSSALQLSCQYPHPSSSPTGGDGRGPFQTTQPIFTAARHPPGLIFSPASVRNRLRVLGSTAGRKKEKCRARCWHQKYSFGSAILWSLGALGL